MEKTSQRILEAATRVFAREGVSGATTREIARLAEVNEVTLFRYFKNKNELLRQVILHCCQRYEDAFAQASFQSPQDLRDTVGVYVSVYGRMLRENEDFIRTFYGELHRHLALCRSLFVDSSKPMRQNFIAYLQSAQKGGLVRADLDIPTAADALSGMLLSGLIRRPLTEDSYLSERYVETCLELFLKGIEP